MRTTNRTYTARPFPEWRLSDLFPWQIGCRSHWLLLHLSKTFGQRHLKGCAQDLSTGRCWRLLNGCKWRNGLTIRRTDSRTWASWIAREHEVVVLPEGSNERQAIQVGIGHVYQHHLSLLRRIEVYDHRISMRTLSNIPQKIHFRVVWSRIFWSVGGRSSISSAMMMVNRSEIGFITNWWTSTFVHLLEFHRPILDYGRHLNPCRLSR